MPPLRVRSPRKPADGGCSYGTRGTVQTGRNPRRFFDRSIAGADRTCRMAAFCPADRAARQHGCPMSTEPLQASTLPSADETVTHAADTPRQQEMPLAVVRGQPVLELPQDLYIPPDALEVILEAFEGPLDLLLYLIRRQNLEILDIPVAEITRQYMEYIEVMRELRLELAAEYLVMAAILAEIKSRLLLPRPSA